jgi:hypothetical protein
MGIKPQLRRTLMPTVKDNRVKMIPDTAQGSVAEAVSEFEDWVVSDDNHFDSICSIVPVEVTSGNWKVAVAGLWNRQA